MIALDDWQEMKRAIDKAHSEYQQMRGRRKQLVRDLKANFGVDSLESARKLLKRLKRKELEAYHVWIKAKRKFKKRFPKIFGVK